MLHVKGRSHYEMCICCKTQKKLVLRLINVSLTLQRVYNECLLTTIFYVYMIDKALAFLLVSLDLDRVLDSNRVKYIRDIL